MPGGAGKMVKFLPFFPGFGLAEEMEEMIEEILQKDENPVDIL